MRRQPKITDNELVARAKGGDNAAYEALIERHKGCFWKACLRQRRRGADHDDCMSLCYEALVKCVQSFDPDMGVKFITYLWRGVAFRMREAYVPGIRVPNSVRNGQFAEHVARARNVLSLDYDYGDGQDLGRVVSSDGMQRPDRVEWGFEHRDALKRGLRGLELRTRRLMRMRLKGYTLEEVAQELGVSKERVRQLQSAAIRKIQKRFPHLIEGEIPVSRVGRPRRRPQVA